MQQINSIYQNIDTDSSWTELHDSFQAEYEKFLQDTKDEIAELIMDREPAGWNTYRTQTLGVLAPWR